MKFFSWANDTEDKRLYELKKSAERYSIELNFMGAGIENFKTPMKTALLLQALSGLDDNEIVCAVDAFDVFFQGDEECIEKRFLAQKCDILIAVERGYSHQYARFKAYYDKLQCSSPYRYVNAGTIIGYVSALKKVYRFSIVTKLFTLVSCNDFLRRKSLKLTRSIKKRLPGFLVEDPPLGNYYQWCETSDQALVGRCAAKNRDNLNIRFDHQTELYWCTAFEWDDIDRHYTVLDGKLLNKHTHNVPPIIHVPYEAKYRHVFNHLYRKVNVLS